MRAHKGPLHTWDLSKQEPVVDLVREEKARREVLDIAGLSAVRSIFERVQPLRTHPCNARSVLSQKSSQDHTESYMGRTFGGGDYSRATTLCLPRD